MTSLAELNTSPYRMLKIGALYTKVNRSAGINIKIRFLEQLATIHLYVSLILRAFYTPNTEESGHWYTPRPS